MAIKVVKGDRYIGPNIIVQVSRVLTGKRNTGPQRIVEYGLVNLENNSVADLYTETHHNFIKLLQAQRCFFVSRKNGRDENGEQDVE